MRITHKKIAKNIVVEEKIFSKKILNLKKKLFEIFSKYFFFSFPKKISLEIFHMLSKLRMQIFTIKGYGDILADKNTYKLF